ncbi:unnamed protein product [Prunus armeniaca]|uniref:Uncharacterized protein n=1 Tax=Prunus armeniaca TaxID=36596 RepID=A0A6J5UB24_PRUAR|nr:unnamed protein product [Prunus armeniaca]CAB4304014.1 unnamed protein product [Prunus armeniaca]
MGREIRLGTNGQNVAVEIWSPVSKELGGRLRWKVWPNSLLSLPSFWQPKATGFWAKVMGAKVCKVNRGF